MSKFKERAFAYIIDMIIVSLAFSIITVFFNTSSNYKKLNQELDDVKNEIENKIEQALESGDNNIDLDSLIHKQAEINHDLDKEIIMFNVLNGFLLVGYFVILPYYWNGQTVGKRVMGINIISNEGALTFNQLIIRALIIDGLGSLVILLSVVYILTGFPYYIVNMLLNALETILTVISIIFIIKRPDHRAVHDLLSGTKVI